MTASSVLVGTTTFSKYVCTVDSNVGTGDFSLVHGTLHVCGHARMQSHVSPGMNGNTWYNFILFVFFDRVQG